MKQLALDLIQHPNVTTETLAILTPVQEGRAASELIHRSRRFVDAMNSRSFEGLSQMVGPAHIAANFTAHLDNPAFSLS